MEALDSSGWTTYDIAIFLFFHQFTYAGYPCKMFSSRKSPTNPVLKKEQKKRFIFTDRTPLFECCHVNKLQYASYTKTFVP